MPRRSLPVPRQTVLVIDGAAQQAAAHQVFEHLAAITFRKIPQPPDLRGREAQARLLVELAHDVKGKIVDRRDVPTAQGLHKTSSGCPDRLHVRCPERRRTWPTIPMLTNASRAGFPGNNP